MNGWLLGALLVAAAVGVTMLSCSRTPQEAVNAQPAAKPQQWEYRIEDMERKKAEDFNKLGADGWEYAGFQADHGQTVFKRPKR